MSRYQQKALDTSAQPRDRNNEDTLTSLLHALLDNRSIMRPMPTVKTPAQPVRRCIDLNVMPSETAVTLEEKLIRFFRGRIPSSDEPWEDSHILTTFRANLVLCVGKITPRRARVVIPDDAVFDCRSFVVLGKEINSTVGDYRYDDYLRLRADDVVAVLAVVVGLVKRDPDMDRYSWYRTTYNRLMEQAVAWGLANDPEFAFAGSERCSFWTLHALREYREQTVSGDVCSAVRRR